MTIAMKIECGTPHPTVLEVHIRTNIDHSCGTGPSAHHARSGVCSGLENAYHVSTDVARYPSEQAATRHTELRSIHGRITLHVGNHPY